MSLPSGLLEFRRIFVEFIRLHDEFGSLHFEFGRLKFELIQPYFKLRDPNVKFRRRNLQFVRRNVEFNRPKLECGRLKLEFFPMNVELDPLILKFRRLNNTFIDPNFKFGPPFSTPGFPNFKLIRLNNGFRRINLEHSEVNATRSRMNYAFTWTNCVKIRTFHYAPPPDGDQSRRNDTCQYAEAFHRAIREPCDA